MDEVFIFCVTLYNNILSIFQVDDLGAIKPSGETSKNYTLEDYYINEWYYSWLPHKNKRQDGITTFQVRQSVNTAYVIVTVSYGYVF